MMGHIISYLFTTKSTESFIYLLHNGYPSFTCYLRFEYYTQYLLFTYIQKISLILVTSKCNIHAVKKVLARQKIASLLASYKGYRELYFQKL